jgi:LmbE family N-acetylglucosaminyl deacetylase
MKTAPLAAAYPWEDFERVVILSPHLDDAALSCGGLLQFLKDRETSCLVISVYCGNPPPVKGQDGSLRTFQRKGYVNPRLRRKEDIAAMHAMDADFVHLGFADSIYRRSPLTNEFIYRRSRERWVSPRVDDLAHVEELYLVLRRLCHNLGRILLVSPMGIGQHVDHTIVAQVALRVAEGGTSLLFFEDFPYVVDREVGSGVEDGPAQALLRLKQEAVLRHVLPVDAAAKASLISRYRSQIPALFDDEQGLEEALQGRKHDGAPCEFYWRARELREAQGPKGE